MTPPDIKSVSEVKRKLTPLKMWTDWFGLVDTKVPNVLSWIESQTDYTNVQPLFLTKTGDIMNG